MFAAPMGILEFHDVQVRLSHAALDKTQLKLAHSNNLLSEKFVP